VVSAIRTNRLMGELETGSYPHNWKASYVVLDSANAEVSAEIVRVAYGVEATVNKVNAAGFPSDLAEILRKDGRPNQSGPFLLGVVFSLA
jgi:hypothetical protein